MRNATEGHDPSDLGELERQVLELVWSRREITADAVREALRRPLKDSTVRTVLRRLEEKGYLVHALEGRTFVYHPAAPRERVAARAVKRIADWFCEGSVESLLVGLVESDALNRRELEALAGRIARVRGGRK
jgi:BlaI family transcriptional regulator, penicillinase repressor